MQLTTTGVARSIYIFFSSSNFIAIHVPVVHYICLPPVKEHEGYSLFLEILRVDNGKLGLFTIFT